eukprot:1572384-Rhodomonas_salina.1
MSSELLSPTKKSHTLGFWAGDKTLFYISTEDVMKFRGNLRFDHCPEGEKERQVIEDVRPERQPLGVEGGEAARLDRHPAEGQGGTDRGQDEGAEDVFQVPRGRTHDPEIVSAQD